MPLKRNHSEMGTTREEVEEHKREEDGEQTEYAHERWTANVRFGGYSPTIATVHVSELTNDDKSKLDEVDGLVPLKDSEVAFSITLLGRLQANTDKAVECRDIIKDSYQKLKAEKITAKQFAQQAQKAWEVVRIDECDDYSEVSSMKRLGRCIEGLKKKLEQHRAALMMEVQNPRSVALAELVAESMAEKAESVAAKAEHVADRAQAVAGMAGATYNLLYHLATLCDKTEMSTIHSGTMSTLRPQGQNMIPQPDWNPSVGSMERLLKGNGNPELTGKYDEHDKTLYHFSRFLSSIVCSAEKIKVATSKKDMEGDPKKIDATVNAIANYLAKDCEQEDLANANGFGIPVPADQEVGFGIPAPPNQEVHGVQPILTAIIFKVASLVEASRIKGSDTSPSKVVLNERLIEPLHKEDGEPGGRWRKADAKIHKEQKAMSLEPRSLIPITAEFIPLGQRDQSLFDLLDKGRDQVLGHMAKRLISAFDFGGVGVDGHCTGLIMTLASVEVVQLCFKRQDFSVKLHTTGQLPLFPKDCVQKLLDGESKDLDKCKEKFLEQLFSHNNCDIPAGLVLLWKLLNTPSLDLASDYWEGGTYTSEDKPEDPDHLKLNKRLGSGAFGMVYSVQDNDSLVVKVVQSGQSPSIQNEIQVLKELSKICVHIPSLESHGKVSVCIRGVSVQLTAMLTSPRGDSNTHELAVQCLLKLEDLCMITVHVQKALKSAHERGFYHLDVRPSNIIRTKDDQGTNYVLVDWGCAKRENEEVTGFVGSTYYAHSEIHKKCDFGHKWQPTEQFDKASLLYTLVVLYCRGHVLWRHSGKLDQKHRKAEVEKIINKWKDEDYLSDDKLKDLLDATNWSSEWNK